MIPEWFENAKLGIFIHWGIFSVNGPQSFAYHNISQQQYMEENMKGFTAENYHPEEWAELFRKAGAKYAVLTTKHHDGVALWDSKFSNNNVVKKTPAGRDLVTPYAEAMRKAGLKVGMYFSHPDWSIPEYFSVYANKPVEEIKELYKRPTPFSKFWQTLMANPDYTLTEQQKKDWDIFMKIYLGQVDEVVHRFGKIDLFWGDGMYEHPSINWQKKKVWEIIKSANPETIISRLPEYQDVDTPEVRMPCSPVSKNPWEYCTTINDNWTYYAPDRNHKTPAELIRIFCDIITMGGNLLLNVGPKPDGTIDKPETEGLLALGAFIEKNQEAIYNTRRGLDWRFYSGGSVFSQDRRTLYLFVHDIPRQGIMIKGIDNEIISANILSTGEPLRTHYYFGRGYGCFWIHLNQEQADPDTTTVVRIQFASPCKEEDRWGMLWEHWDHSKEN